MVVHCSHTPKLDIPNNKPTRQYYVKPYVARKQRYDRWARRRSLAKINALLDRVRYDKAMYVLACWVVCCVVV